MKDRQKPLTAKQKKKADKVFKLIAELSSENVTFFMNSTPTLHLSFLRNHDHDMDLNEYTDFYNDNTYEDLVYEPSPELQTLFKLECYGF